MNNTVTNELNGMKEVCISIKNTLISSETKIEDTFYSYFGFLNSIASFIFQNVGDNRILKAKFEKYIQR